MRKFASNLAFALAALLAIVTVSLIVQPGRLKAQFSGQSTWLSASQIGGSGNALTFSGLNITQMSDLLGVPLRFIPPNANAAGGTTINPVGLGIQAVKRTSAGALIAIADHDFSTAAYAEVVWDGTEFVQTNPATGNAPVGSEIAVTNGAPNGYLIEAGQCVSQTTYAALYAYYGNTDLWLTQAGGVACSAGNFHLPFANGRAAVAFDRQGGVTAGVLTSAGSGCAATVVAVGCGAQNQTVAQNQLPNVAPSISGDGSNVTVTNSGGTSFIADTGSHGNLVSSAGNGTQQATASFPVNNVASHLTVGSINGNVTQQTLATVQPTYTVLKAVKY